MNFTQKCIQKVKRSDCKIMELAKIIIIASVLSIQHDQTSACKGSGKDKGSKGDAEIPKMNKTYFNVTTISNYYENKFVSELWRKEEIKERLLLHSVYEITTSPCLVPSQKFKSYPSLDIKLNHINKKNIETTLLNINTNFSNENRSLRYSLRCATPLNSDSFSMTDISNGRKQMKSFMEFKDSDSSISISILLDFKTYNFFWCFGETNTTDLSYCFLDRNIESISKFSENLLNGNIFLSIEDSSNHRNNCSSFDKLIMSHNSLVSKKMESSENTFSDSAFAKQMLHTKSLSSHISNTFDLNLETNIVSTLCNKSTTKCTFNRNLNLFCFNETIKCHNYVQKSFHWKGLAQETIIDLHEIEIWSLEYITIRPKLNGGLIHIMDENHATLDIIRVDKLTNDTRLPQAYRISDHAFESTFNLDMKEGSDHSISLVFEVSSNISKFCSKEPNARLYVALQESQVIDRMEYFGDIKPNTRHWRFIKVVGFESGFEIKFDTWKPEVTKLMNKSAIKLEEDGLFEYKLTCNQNFDQSIHQNHVYFIPIMVGSISIFLIVFLVIIVIVSIVRTNHKSSKQKIHINDNKFDETDIGRNTVQNEYDVPVMEKSTDNEYDDCIDVDAIEESAYCTNLPNKGFDSRSNIKCSSTNLLIDHDNISMFQDENGETLFVMKDFQ